MFVQRFARRFSDPQRQKAFEGMLSRMSSQVNVAGHKAPGSRNRTMAAAAEQAGLSGPASGGKIR